MKNWQTSVYKLLGFLGSIISLDLFVGAVAPHLNWVERVFAVFFGFLALLSSFLYFTLMLPQEYRIIRFEQIDEHVINAKQGSDREFE
jgi:hypothetical protein